MKSLRIPILLGTLLSATLLQAQTPIIVSATKVGTSDKVRVTFNTPVTPAGATDLLTDDFSGASVDPTKWSSNATPWLVGGTLDPVNTSVVQANGQVEFDVFAATDWGGVSLKTVSSFSASLSQPLVFEITREFFDQNANYAFPGVWITDNTRTKFVYFGEDFGTDPVGWQYKRQIGDPGFDNVDPEEGTWNTALVNDDSIDGDFFNNGEDHRIKVVVDGTTVRLYLDGFFASEVSFPLASGIFFEFGAYCSTFTPDDDNEVNTAFSEARVARLNAVSLSNFSINNGATVTGVSITSDPKVLELTTTGVANGSPYTLTVTGVQCSDGTPIAPSSTIAIQTTATKNAAYAAAILADNPRAYFQMDQINGTNVPNLGSAATPGTYKALGGPDRSELTPGAGLPLLPGFAADNTAALFDGIKDYIDTGVPYFRSPLSAFTIELWVKPAFLNDERLGLVGNDDSSAPIEFGFIDPGFGDPGIVQLWTANGGEVEAPYPFPYNEWHQIVAVGNGTNLLLYFDGVLAGTDGDPIANYGDDGAVPTYIGLGVFDFLDAGVGGWQGAMDEIAIYTNALSAARIKAHFDIGYAAELHPTITITNPVSNATIPAGASVTIGVQVSAAPGRTVSRVQFFDNGNLIGEDTTSPFSLDIPSIDAGRHVLTARVFDDLGVSGVSAPVKFEIGNLPLVVFVVPAPADDLSDSDEAVREHLRGLGFDVVLVSASALTANDVSEAVLVVASDTDNDDAVSLLAGLPVPIVTWDEGQQPNFLFVEDAGESDWNDEDNAFMNVVNTSHPIAVAAGLTNGSNEIQDAVEWGTDEYWAPWGVPSSEATIIATTVNIVPDANPVPGSSRPAQIYAYTNGAALIDDSPSPERRVFLPIDNRWNSDIGFQLLSDTGVAVFDAAVNWAALPYFSPPTVQGGNLNLSWVGGLGGTLQSADTLNGPWTAITGATSPHLVPITGSSKFFRIKR